MNRLATAVDLSLQYIPETEQYQEVRDSLTSVYNFLDNLYKQLQENSEGEWMQEILEGELNEINTPDKVLQALASAIRKISNEYAQRTEEEFLNVLNNYEAKQSELTAMQELDDIDYIRKNQIQTIQGSLNRAVSKIQNIINIIKEKELTISTESLEKASLELEIAQLENEAHDERIDFILEMRVKDSNTLFTTEETGGILSFMGQEIGYLARPLVLSGDLTNEDYSSKGSKKVFTLNALKKLMAYTYIQFKNSERHNPEALIAKWASYFKGEESAEDETDDLRNELVGISKSFKVLDSDQFVINNFGIDAYNIVKTLENKAEEDPQDFITNVTVSDVGKLVSTYSLYPSKSKQLSKFVLHDHDYIKVDKGTKGVRYLTIRGILRLLVTYTDYASSARSYSSLIPNLAGLVGEGKLSENAYNNLLRILNNQEELGESDNSKYPNSKSKLFGLVIKNLNVDESLGTQNEEAWVLNNDFGDYVSAVFSDYPEKITESMDKKGLYNHLAMAKTTLVNTFKEIYSKNPTMTVSEVVDEMLLLDRKFVKDISEILRLVKSKFGNYLAINFVEFGLRSNKKPRKSESRELLNRLPRMSITTMINFRTFLEKDENLAFFMSRFNISQDPINLIREHFDNIESVNSNEVTSYKYWSREWAVSVLRKKEIEVGDLNKEEVTKTIDFIIDYVNGDVKPEAFNVWIQNILVEEEYRYAPVIVIIAIVMEAMKAANDSKKTFESEYIIHCLQELRNQFKI